MDSTLQDLRLAIRALARRPAFTAVAAGTLAVGMGAATAVFSVVDRVLLQPLPYEDASALVTLQRTTDGAEGGGGAVSYPDFLDWRDASGFSSMAAYEPSTVTLTGLGDPEVLAAGRVTPQFFRVFAEAPVLGRGFAPEESVEGGPAVVILSHGFWQGKLASDPDVLSRTIVLDGRPHQVVGVAPPGFDFPGDARVWLPVQNPGGCGRECPYLEVIARLAPGTPLSRAREAMKTLVGRLENVYPESYRDSRVAVVPLHEVVVGDARPGVLAVLGAVVLVLLIACANVANLLLLRGVDRADEVSLRSALGAGGPRIVRQLLMESLVLAAVAGGLGLLLTAWGLDLIRALAPSELPRMAEVGIDVRVVGFTGLLVLATALLFGLRPALRLAGIPAVGVLGGPPGGGIPAPGAGWAGTALLVVEVALSLVLLTGAGLLLRSARELQEIDPGFDPAEVLTFGISLPGSRYPGASRQIEFFRSLEERLAADPRVEASGAALGSPLGPDVQRVALRRADAPPPSPGHGDGVVLRRVTPGYFRALRISRLQGRLFDDRDGADAPRVVVVSHEAAQRFWPGEDPVGKAVVLGMPPATADSVARVVGVVGDVRSVAWTEEPVPEVYVPFPQDPGPRLTVHVRALPGIGGTEGLMAVVRDQVWTLDADLPLVGLGTLADRVRAGTARSRFYLALVGLFAVVAVSLAAVGLYGVVAYLVSRRRREIGLRMALGAEDHHVVRLAVREGLTPALVGVGVGIPGALAVTRVLGTFVYRVPSWDPRTVAATAGLVLGVVLAASLAPARGARRVPPSEALRAP